MKLPHLNVGPTIEAFSSERHKGCATHARTAKVDTEETGAVLVNSVQVGKLKRRTARRAWSSFAPG